MPDAKVTGLGSLTGANVANGDAVMIVDVSDTTMAGTGTNKRITADELAQIPQLTSRYKPLASDSVFIPGCTFGQQFGATVGTLGNGTSSYNRTPVMLFSHISDQGAATLWEPPPSWATLDIYVWWSNAGANSGVVEWIGSWDSFAATESSDVTGTQVVSRVTAPAQYVFSRFKINSSAVSVATAELLRVSIARGASSAADTLDNAAGLVGIELVRAS